jgi:hypothetical protein
MTMGERMGQYPPTAWSPGLMCMAFSRMIGSVEIGSSASEGVAQISIMKPRLIVF